MPGAIQIPQPARRAHGLPFAPALVLLLASGRAAGAEPCLSPAEQGLTSGGRIQLEVGYAESPPLAWNAEGHPQEPVGIAVDVLALVAKHNGWRLKFHPFSLDDVVANVAACKLDLGIVPRVPPRLWQRQEEALDLTVPYFESVAAIARRQGAGGSSDVVPARPVPGRVGVWVAGAVRAAFFGLWALAILVVLLALVNLRLPRPPGRLLPERLRFVAMDPSVAGLLGALRWLRSARVGRVLAILWIAGGVGVALASAPPAGARTGSEGRVALVAALRRSMDDVEAVGVRPGGRVVGCPDMVRCLQDLARGDLAAVAGGAEAICHYVRAESLDDVGFEPDLQWPRAYAFLVPPAGPLRRTLNAALGKTTAQEAPALAAIRSAYGVPWTAPALSPSCPAGREAHR